MVVTIRPQGSQGEEVEESGLSPPHLRPSVDELPSCQWSFGWSQPGTNFLFLHLADHKRTRWWYRHQFSPLTTCCCTSVTHLESLLWSFVRKVWPSLPTCVCWKERKGELRRRSFNMYLDDSPCECWTHLDWSRLFCSSACCSASFWALAETPGFCLLQIFGFYTGVCGEVGTGGGL